MIIVLAVYSGNAKAALELLRWITEIGGVNHRQFILFYTHGTDPAELILEAQKAFSSVQAVGMHANQEAMDWPRGNNAAFLAVCRHMNAFTQPFLLLEPDVLPIGPGWDVALESEYQQSGMAFMGYVRTVHNRRGETIPDSLHMNGAGIYPGHVLRYLPSAVWLENVYAGEPYDIALRFEMLYRKNASGEFALQNGQRISHCHATARICFCWHSTNFRVEPGAADWKCDMGPHSTYRPIDFSRHVLHHGCKDGSLLTLLRQRLRIARGQLIDPSSMPSLSAKGIIESTLAHLQSVRAEFPFLPPVEKVETEIASLVSRKRKKRGPGRPKKRGPKKGSRRKTKISGTVPA